MKFVITFLLLVAISAESATYYVRTNGNDSGAGTVGDPWLTIEKATTTMVAGDTSLVGDGWFFMDDTPTSNHGTPASPIILQSENMLGATFGGRMYVTKSNWVIRGFQITNRLYFYNTSCVDSVAESNFIHSGTATDGGSIWIEGTPESGAGTNWCQRILIRHNTFSNGVANAFVVTEGRDHQIYSNLFTEPQGWDMFRTWGDGVKIWGNVFTNLLPNGTNANHTDILQTFSSGNTNSVSRNLWFFRNKIYESSAQMGNLETDTTPPGGVNAANFHGWRIFNNLFVRSRLTLNNSIQDLWFVHNTCVGFTNTVTASNVQFSDYGDRGSGEYGRVWNNLFVGSQGNENYGCYSVGTSLTNAFGDHNYIGDPDGSAKAGAAIPSEPNGENGGWDINDIWESWGSDDYRLKAASPAIDYGTNLVSVLSLLSVDIDGNPRDSQPDIGAYEYVSGGGGGSSGPLTITTSTATIGRISGP